MDLCSKRVAESQDGLLTALGLPDKPPHADPKRVLAAVAMYRADRPEPRPQPPITIPPRAQASVAK